MNIPGFAGNLECSLRNVCAKPIVYQSEDTMPGAGSRMGCGAVTTTSRAIGPLLMTRSS
jgi:hypothetical protein